MSNSYTNISSTWETLLDYASKGSREAEAQLIGEAMQPDSLGYTTTAALVMLVHYGVTTGKTPDLWTLSAKVGVEQNVSVPGSDGEKSMNIKASKGIAAKWETLDAAIRHYSQQVAASIKPASKAHIDNLTGQTFNASIASMKVAGIVTDKTQEKVMRDSIRKQIEAEHAPRLDTATLSHLSFLVAIKYRYSIDFKPQDVRAVLGAYDDGFWSRAVLNGIKLTMLDNRPTIQEIYSQYKARVTGEASGVASKVAETASVNAEKVSA